MEHSLMTIACVPTMMSVCVCVWVCACKCVCMQTHKNCMSWCACMCGADVDLSFLDVLHYVCPMHVHCGEKTKLGAGLPACWIKFSGTLHSHLCIVLWYYVSKWSHCTAVHRGLWIGTQQWPDRSVITGVPVYRYSPIHDVMWSDM